MKWNELQEKAKVKLLTNLSSIEHSLLVPDRFYTDAEMEQLVTIKAKAGTYFTVYIEGNVVELFDEATDNTLRFYAHNALPCWIEVI